MINMPHDMPHLIRTAFALIALLFTTATYACRYDIDCRPGARCVKGAGLTYGQCKSVDVIGDTRVLDRPDLKTKGDVNRTYSTQCKMLTDCRAGYRCARASGADWGFCVRTTYESLDLEAAKIDTPPVSPTAKAGAPGAPKAEKGATPPAQKAR